MLSEADHLTAEQRFHQAFERLKANKPNVLKPGTPVSQNNVALEAGRDTSALRKARFPALVREIQTYVDLHQEERPSKNQERKRERAARADLKARLEQVVSQRDQAQSQLASAHRRIIDLISELEEAKKRLIESAPITPLRP